MRFITDEPAATIWIRRVSGSDESLGTAAAAGEFTITAAYGEDGHSATYTVTGPFQNNTNYQLRYPTSFAAEQGQPDKAVVGRQYFNHVELDGGAMKEGACVVVQQGFGVGAGANLTPKPEPTLSVEPKQPEPTEGLAHTGTDAGTALAISTLLIGAGVAVYAIRTGRIR